MFTANNKDTRTTQVLVEFFSVSGGIIKLFCLFRLVNNKEKI